MNRKRWVIQIVFVTMFFLTACAPDEMGKPDNPKEFEQAAKEKLQEQYGESFVIKPAKKECIALTKQEEKDCNRQLFAAEASPKNNANIVFTVNYYLRGGSFDNDYLEQYMTYDLQRRVQSRLQIKNMMLHVNVSYHSTENNPATYTGSVKNYQQKLKKIPSDTSIYVYLLDGKQSIEQKAEQIYSFSQIPELRALATSFTVNYYATLPQNGRNPYRQDLLSSISFTIEDLKSLPSIRAKIQQEQA
jgi:hypothetical protein